MTVTVTGAPLSIVTSSPLSLSPTFAPTITDYVLRCQSGINTVQLTLAAAPGGAISVGGTIGGTVTVQESLFENQAVIITAPDHDGTGQPARYWIRCLPHDFPLLSEGRRQAPPLGWYLTGNINSSQGSGTYAMVLDNEGTPVWYRKTAGKSAWNVTPLAGGRIAWLTIGAGEGFEEYDLNTQVTHWLAAPIQSTDFHELQQLPNGNLMMLSFLATPDIDMTIFGASSRASIVDCVLEEVDPAGQLVWEWRASDHISVSESTHPFFNRLGPEYDIYHCNSIDVDPVTGSILLSARHTDAVYDIDKSTGQVSWKMGGTPFNHDGAQIITISGDPQGAFHAQHDARFQSNGDISLYDNQTWDPSLAARGVEYHVDTVAATATLVWSYQAPDGRNSGATGSFRRLNGGTDNVIGWGFKPNTLFTEVDATGNVMLNVTFPDGEVAYRVIKVPPTALDHNLLRATAGLPPFSFTADTDPTLAGTGGTLSAVEGGSFTTAVASFTDPDSNAQADEYLATIAWGDGSSSPGTITGPGGGPFSVSGTHTYAEEGTNVVTVYITDADDPTNTAIVTSTVNLVDAGLSASCATPANSLTSFSGTAATFTDGDASATAPDYTTTIDWGDGSSAPGAVSGPDGGPFSISGAHVYATTGRFNITTTINDAGGATTSTSCSALIYAFPSATGAFAIGDENSVEGTSVTFWGGKWSKLNSLSGGSAPDSFNGFGQGSVMPTCGVAWDASTGNGNPPAGNTLPTYMGVMVTSSVTQSGSTDSGNAVHVVIVRTKPGYQPDSGHPGTGTVVAQVC